jgi:hypothetical protein
MGWSLTGRGRAEAERIRSDFAQTLESARPASVAQDIDSLRAKLRAIQKDVHVREQAIASIPEMEAVAAPPVAGGRPLPPRPAPRSLAVRGAASMPAVAPLPRPGPAPLPAPAPRPPPLPREEPGTGKMRDRVESVDRVFGQPQVVRAPSKPDR